MNPLEHPVFDNHKLRQSDPQPEIDIEHDFHSHKTYMYEFQRLTTQH